MDWVFIALAVSSGLIFTVGDLAFKYWGIRNHPWFFVIAIIAYVVAGTFLGLSYKRKGLAIAIAFMTCVNFILVIVLGNYLFGETLAFREIAGIALTLCAIILLAI